MDDLNNLKNVLFGVKKKSILVLLLNAISTLLILFLHIAMARILGHQEYSDYSYVITVLTILALINTLGFDTLAQRILPELKIQSNWSVFKGFIVSSYKSVFLLSFFLCLLFVIFLFLFKGLIRPALLQIFWIGLLALPPTSLILLSTGIIKGLKKPALSTLPKLIIKPFLILVIIMIFYKLEFEINGLIAMKIDLAVSILALIFGAFFIYNLSLKKIKGINSQSLLKEWLPISTNILFINLIQLLIRNNDVIFLGIFSGTEISGPYSVASRIALLSGFGLIAINTVIPAIIAKYFSEKKLKSVQSIATMSARLNFFFSIIVASLIIMFNEYILLVFGSEFKIASSALVILCLAQIFNSLTGSVGFILIMTGNQLELYNVLIKALLINILLCFILIPNFGINGAALTTTLTIVLTNLLLAIKCYYKVNIDPSIFGIKKIND